MRRKDRLKKLVYCAAINKLVHGAMTGFAITSLIVGSHGTAIAFLIAASVVAYWLQVDLVVLTLNSLTQKGKPVNLGSPQSRLDASQADLLRQPIQTSQL